MILACVGAICMCFIPESPRYLVSKKKFELARQVFGKIARVNGMEEDIVKDFIFEDELDIRN